MKKAFLILLFAVFTTAAMAQKPQPQDFSASVDSMKVLLKERTGVDVKFSLSKVMKLGKTLDFYFTKELGDYPWRTSEVKWFRDTFFKLSKDKMKG